MYFVDVNFGEKGFGTAEALRRRLARMNLAVIRRRNSVRVILPTQHGLFGIVTIILHDMGQLPVETAINIFHRFDEENPPDVGDTYAANNRLGPREGIDGEAV